MNKSQTKILVPLIGAKSSKRNKGIIQNSPKRKNTPEREALQKQNNGAPCRTTKAKQKLNLQAGDSIPSSSHAAPRINIVPARVKDKVDFHNPPALIP